MARAVDGRCLVEVVGDVHRDVGLRDHEVPYGYAVDDDHQEHRIHQAEIAHHQELRDQTAVKEHREHKIEVYKLFPGEFPAERIGRHHGDDDAQQRAEYRIDNRVEVGADQLVVVKDGLVAHQGEVLRPEQHLSGDDGVRIGDRCDEDQPQRVQDHRQDDHPDNGVDRVKNAVAHRLLYFLFLRVRFFHGVIPFQNRLVSFRRFAIQLTAMIITKLITFVIRPIAVV